MNLNLLMKFLSHNWSSILTIISFILSTWLTVLKIYSSFTNLKIQDFKIFKIDDMDIYLAITITNQSSQNISIYNAKLNHCNFYRAQHHFFGESPQKVSDPLQYILTSNFPINLNSHETADLLLEFISTNPIDLSNQSLQLITSKRKAKRNNLNLSTAEVNFNDFLKFISSNHK